MERTCCALDNGIVDYKIELIHEKLELMVIIMTRMNVSTWRPAATSRTYDVALFLRFTDLLVSLLGLLLFLYSVVGAFAKFRRETASFVMSVCLHGTTLLPLGGTARHLKFECFFFRKYVEKIWVWLNSYRNNGYFTWRLIYICDISLISSWNEKCFRQNL